MFYDTDSIADTFNEDREKREKPQEKIKQLPVNTMTVQKKMTKT